MTVEEQERIAREWHMIEYRVLPDGTFAGIIRLVYTWGLVLGVNEFEWTYRFCFQDLVLARGALRDADSINFEPEGYVARRPKVEEYDQ